ncbi:MAG TPA: M67 family metallopeptidase [Myxococcales bacterium]
MTPIPPSVLREMAAHAQKTYPAECCGLLLACADGSLRFQPISNIAGTREGAGTSARTARDGYVMDPKELLSALEATEKEGGALWAIVHSHPEVGAYFSAEDQRMALGGGQEPLWPGVRYLVISARSAGVDGAKLYTWDGAARTFREEEVAGISTVSRQENR